MSVDGLDVVSNLKVETKRVNFKFRFNIIYVTKQQFVTYMR